MEPEKIRQNDAERDRLLRLNSWADRISTSSPSIPCRPAKDVMAWAILLVSSLEDSAGVWDTACQKAWENMHA